MISHWLYKVVLYATNNIDIYVFVFVRNAEQVHGSDPASECGLAYPLSCGT